MDRSIRRLEYGWVRELDAFLHNLRGFCCCMFCIGVGKTPGIVLDLQRALLPRFKQTQAKIMQPSIIILQYDTMLPLNLAVRTLA